MNLALIHHGKPPLYLFQAPEGIRLKKDDKALVSTKKGETDGVCACDSFELSEDVAQTIALAYGATFPLKSVIGKYNLIRFTTPHASPEALDEGDPSDVVLD